MSMHKSFESKVLVLNRNFENVDDELQNSVVNVPIVSEKSAKKLSTLIEPMKKATFREQIMPFELSPKPDFEKSMYVYDLVDHSRITLVKLLSLTIKKKFKTILD